MPAVGFGLGLERLLLVLENTSKLAAEPEHIQYYFAPIGDSAREIATRITANFRSLGLSAETDIMDRSVKSQMKYADKIGAEWVVVIGDDEVEKGEASAKNLRTGATAIWTFDKLLSPSAIEV